MVSSLQLIGYKINGEIFYSIEDKALSNANNSSQVIKLRNTMASLLEYLLKHSREELVSDDELRKKIWEANNLSFSSQRKWQVINQLNKKIANLDPSSKLIYRIRGKGYYMKHNQINRIFKEI